MYATEYRTVSVETTPLTFASRGRLPNPAPGMDGFRHRLRTTRGWKSAVERVVGHFPSIAVQAITDSDMVATSDRWVFRSADGGREWTVSASLPASSGLMGVLPTALCSHDGTVYLGEYPLDGTTTPRIRRSDDHGQTWSTVTELDGVRHVHAVQRDPFTGDLWVTTGDADAECQIGRLQGGEFRPVGGGSQDWRAVSLVFTPSAVLWGMDCVYATENRIQKLSRTSIGDPAPSPEPVHTVPGSVYYGASLSVDGTQWAVFSTAVETTSDSTAGDTTVRSGERAYVVASSADSGFSEWVEVCSFRPRTTVANRLRVLPSANTYVFLAADDDRGLFVNPYNTMTDHGTVTVVPPDRLPRCDE